MELLSKKGFPLEIFSRNCLYWGEDNQQILKSKHIAVFGLGGVGGFCAESLARAGIGELTLIDFDTVSRSNINRQIIAMHSTIGKSKTELFEQRLKDINPDIKLNIIDDFYTDEAFGTVDFVADAIDTMRSKITLLETCIKNGIPVISSMGAGNRIDPSKLYICDISEIENKNAPFVSNGGAKRELLLLQAAKNLLSKKGFPKPKKSQRKKTEKILNL